MRKIILLYFTIILLGCQEKIVDPDTQLLQKAQLIHLNSLTLDTHDDINVKNFTDSLNYTMDTDTQVNLPKMERGGLDVAWFIVYTGQGELTEQGYKKAAANAQSKFNAINRLVNDYAPDKIGLARSHNDINILRKMGKKVAMIGVENAYPLGENLNEVKRYYDLGARYMSLAHNGHNQFSDSNTGEFDNTTMHKGISELGRKVIDSMNYYGIMVDISHPSKESIRQTIAYSKAPVIASHSGARKLSDHPRNLDDQQLEWVKENGGVVQAVALGLFVNKEKHKKHQSAVDSIYRLSAEKLEVKYLTQKQLFSLSEDARNAYKQTWNAIKSKAAPALEKAKIKFPAVNVADFIDHIDYIKSKIGVEHVGISSDFDGGGGIEGWQDASETLNVTLELVKRGYTEDEIGKIWSGNLLRVLDETEATANSIQGK